VPATASATISSSDLKTVNIKISYDTQSSSIAASLKTGFSGMGFENVVNEISKVSTPEKSSVIFSQNISTDLRSSIITEIKEVLQNFSILESQDASSTIDISIGKS
jgi:ABC-type molybdate transport system ATPase subunit